MEKHTQLFRAIKNQMLKTGNKQTPEILSLFDDYLRELKRTMDLNPIKISPQAHVENLLILVCKFRKALAKKPEFNAESKELRLIREMRVVD